MQILPLSDLKPGQTGVIERLDLSDEVSGKLMELGLCPGEKVQVIRWSPFGDPVEIELLGYRLAIRRHEADTIYLSCPL